MLRAGDLDLPTDMLTVLYAEHPGPALATTVAAERAAAPASAPSTADREPAIASPQPLAAVRLAGPACRFGR